MSKDHDFVTEFIEIYRSFPCLWRKTDVQYHNTVKRDQAYNILLQKYKEYDTNATKKTVLSKINSLRSAFNKEYKKVKASERSGAATEEVYTPSLWYYNLLEFLHENTSLGGNTSTITEESEASETQTGLENSLEDDEIVQPVSVASSQEDLTQTPSSVTNKKSESSRAPKRTNVTEAAQKSKLLHLVAKRLEVPQSDSANAIFGRHIAAELDNLVPEMIPLAKKLISDVIFEGHMKTLNRTSKISTQPEGSSAQFYQYDYQQQPGTSTLQYSTSAQNSGNALPTTNHLVNYYNAIDEHLK